MSEGGREQAVRPETLMTDEQVGEAAEALAQAQESFARLNRVIARSPTQAAAVAEAVRYLEERDQREENGDMTDLFVALRRSVEAAGGRAPSGDTSGGWDVWEVRTGQESPKDEDEAAGASGAASASPTAPPGAKRVGMARFSRSAAPQGSGSSASSGRTQMVEQRDVSTAEAGTSPAREGGPSRFDAERTDALIRAVAADPDLVRFSLSRFPGGEPRTRPAEPVENQPTGQPNSSATQRTKLTVALPTEDIALLEQLAKAWTNKTTALIRAIRIASYLQDAARRGAKVLVEDRDGSRREIVIM